MNSSLRDVGFGVCLLIAGCGGGGGGAALPIMPVAAAPAAPAPAPAPAPTPAPAPAPAPLKVVEVAEDLDSPWSLAFLPDGRMLITERGGRLRLRHADGRVPEGGDLIAGVPAVDARGQGGLLDVVLDPAFASNRRIYFSFSERDANGANGTAVARAELDAANRRLQALTVIFRQTPKVRGSTLHYGSRLVFDRAGHLFVTLGERSAASERGFAQSLAHGHGKVMRITTDGAPAPGNPRWSEPGAQPEIWSYGHRNMQGAALHPETGELWASEHGPRGGDEINRVLPGRNYGWPVVSHGFEYGTTTQVGEGTEKAGMEPAAFVWLTRDGSPLSGDSKGSAAPAGLVFYTGDRFPEWKGQLFSGTLAGTALWRFQLQGAAVVGRERLLADRGERIRDVRQGPDGWLWLLTDGGKLLRLER